MEEPFWPGGARAAAIASPYRPNRRTALRQHGVASSGSSKQGFPKRARLLRSVEFRKVYDQGRRRSLDFLVAFAMENGQPHSRIGLTVPRAVGGSVERNRIRRRLRESIRKRLAELGPGWDIVLNVRQTAKAVDFAVLDETIAKYFCACARHRLA
jgi:ribonuclease P protein component